jgi:hypothetical protein
MKSNNSQHESNKRASPRKIKHAPFAWQHKGALRMIRDVFEDGHGHCAFALAIYLGLTELASDAQSETFTVAIKQIARRAGASYPTTAKILNRFESLRLIHVQRNTVEGTKEHAPSTFTMLETPFLTLEKRDASRLPRRLKNWKNRNKPNTGNAGSDGSTRNVKSKPQRPASPGLEGKEKDSDWLRRTPLHVLKRRREEYQNERSRLLKQYSNGASDDGQKIANFRKTAPSDARRRYDWLRPKIEEIEQTIMQRSRP